MTNERVGRRVTEIGRDRSVNDPRLCSIHLEAQPRRADYRRAREALLGGCGQNTLAASRDQLAELQSQRNLPPESQATITPLHFWLLDKEAVYHLKVGLNTIGRMPDNDVAILDSSVSRRHCAIVIHASRGCELYDTASKNGTFVNGHRINTPTTLKAGDEIRLCDRQLVFLTDTREKPPLPASQDSGERTHVEI